MLGLGRLVSPTRDAIGTVMSRREGLAVENRRLVGLVPVDPGARLVAGAHLFADGARQSLETGEGWITSACFSPHMDSRIGLAFLERGKDRLDEIIIAANPLEGESVQVRVVSLPFIDPAGDRLRA
jgi:sarcosine oxidase subunit alpha